MVKDRTATENDLKNIDAVRDQLWVTTFYDMIRFVQERDTAQLTVHSASESEIRFELADWMDDSIYDYPLTVKFRVPNNWVGAKATQNGSALDVQTVENEGNLYALVQAVPDAGEVVLSDAAETEEWGGFFADADGHADTGDWLGWLYIRDQPWLYSHDLGIWVYGKSPHAASSGTWLFFMK